MNYVPELPRVTNLAISIYVGTGGHTIGATLTKLIAKCKNVEYISIGFNDWVGIFVFKGSICFSLNPSWTDQTENVFHCCNCRKSDIARICRASVASQRVGRTREDLTGSP